MLSAATRTKGRCKRDSYNGDVSVQGVRSSRSRHPVCAKLAVLPNPLVIRLMFIVVLKMLLVSLPFLAYK
jgi:hypothetical protein